MTLHTVYATELHTGRERQQGTFDNYADALECKRVCEIWSARAYIIDEPGHIVDSLKSYTGKTLAHVLKMPQGYAFHHMGLSITREGFATWQQARDAAIALHNETHH